MCITSHSSATNSPARPSPAKLRRSVRRQKRNHVAVIPLAIFCWAALLAEPLLMHSVQAADWPYWRGQNRNAVSEEKDLAQSWDQAPEVAWHATNVGQGYSSAVVENNVVYVTGSFQKEVRCTAMNASTGKLIWQTAIGETSRNVMSTPTVHAGFVYAVDPDGELVCLETATGKNVWQKSYTKEFGGRLMSGRGYGESPLIDGDRLIFMPGGPDAMLVAVDRKTGKTIWKSTIPEIGSKGRDGAAFSSITISNAAGVKQYVTMCGRGLIGIDAASGKFLWGYNDISNQTANIPTPIISEDFVFCANGYHAGAVLLKIKPAIDKDGLMAQEVYRLKGNRFQNHHGGFVLIDGHIYGGHGSNNGLPTCLDMATGEIKWKRRGAGTGSASVLAADGNLIFKYQDGTVAVIEATPDAYNLRGTFNIPNSGADGWSHPVISNGRLLLREKDHLWAYNVRPSGRSIDPVKNPLPRELVLLSEHGIKASYLFTGTQPVEAGPNERNSHPRFSAFENLYKYAHADEAPGVALVTLTNKHLTTNGGIARDTFDRLQALKSPFVLSLAGTKIQSIGFSQVAKLPRVTGLSVELCQDLDAACFGAIATSKSIRVLDATGTDISSEHLAKLASSRLLALDLEVCDAVNTDACRALARIKTLRALNLKKTAFEKDRISDSGLKELTQLVNLELLNLTGNAITNDGMQLFVEFKRLRGLSLNLLGINDKGISFLQDVDGLLHLELLYSEGFAGPKLTDVGIKSLAKLKQLETLNIVGAKVTDAAIPSLSQLTRLKQLMAVNTRLTQAGIAQLQLAIPKCQIDASTKQ